MRPLQFGLGTNRHRARDLLHGRVSFTRRKKSASESLRPAAAEIQSIEHALQNRAALINPAHPGGEIPLTNRELG